MERTCYSRREFLKNASKTASALALSAAGVLAGCKSQRNVLDNKHARPNIIFIFSDDHAYQAISAYDSRLANIAPTPNIDRIAKEGMLFKKAYVTNSICAPSRAVILTGKHSHLNGVIDNGVEFDGAQQTFPKLLQKLEYQTAIIGKWHLKSQPTGFDYWHTLPGQGHYYNPDFITPEGKITESGYVTDIITDKSLDWLENGRNKSKPFMLMLQHKAPHREWDPPTKHLNLFDDVTIPEPDNLFDTYDTRGTAAHEQDMTIEKTMRLEADNKVWDKSNRSPAWQYNYGRMNEEQRLAWDAAYDPKNEAFKKAKLSGKDLVRWKYQRYMKDYLRCIRSVDDNVGRVLDYLDKTGMAGNTVVIYSSDQGFYLGEHGWFDKRFMYKESFRTPLVARWPGVIKSNKVNDDLVQNLDFAQTFLDIAGIQQLPSDMQGLSLKPLMAGEAPANWRKSLYYHYYEYPGFHSVRRHEGVATKRYKLISFYDLDEWEFYDLEKDPHEMNNLYNDPAYQKKIVELKKELTRLKILYKVP
jgi:arylsulfatase A-like enzyme